jgi:hypothetical protein
MMRMFTMGGMMIGGAVGSWLAGRFGLFVGFMGGIVGTAVGVYAGRKLAQHLGG